MWMEIDLNYYVDTNGNGKGVNTIGIPGILYDQNNQVMDTAAKFGAYLEYLGIVTSDTGDNIQSWNPCTQQGETYFKKPSGWGGTNFNIFPGQGIDIIIGKDCVLPLKFGQGYKKHLICNETVDKYCEWSGQEEFDKL